jgi:hypothetical protein
LTNDKKCDGLRLCVENDRLRSEIGLLQREIEIKDTRFGRLDPKKRPHYLPSERLAILTIRAMRDLTNEQTAKRFQVNGTNNHSYRANLILSHWLS